MLDIEGVKNFQWAHHLVVQFEDRDRFTVAKQLTGWTVWDQRELVLEAQISSEEGFEHPAIIVNDKAYCGFMVVPELTAPMVKVA
ncbi:hypothetical protein SAMN05446927_6553 [Caballeronia arationis]|uniref:Uncharacterized protein n=1 Tax=Caballeronia arationis TaxID=1777142 RepID=A0A7Z7ICD5_9BURK|nr:hypothetical protein [Caballeronia arationis]SOE87964.1 hypothetical protein SAMN05446927_6553 [Caballeronia arationis]